LANAHQLKYGQVYSADRRNRTHYLYDWVMVKASTFLSYEQSCICRKQINYTVTLFHYNIRLWRMQGYKECDVYMPIKQWIEWCV